MRMRYRSSNYVAERGIQVGTWGNCSDKPVKVTKVTKATFTILFPDGRTLDLSSNTGDYHGRPSWFYPLPATDWQAAEQAAADWTHISERRAALLAASRSALEVPAFVRVETSLGKAVRIAVMEGANSEEWDEVLTGEISIDVLGRLKPLELDGLKESVSPARLRDLIVILETCASRVLNEMESILASKVVASKGAA